VATFECEKADALAPISI